MYLSATTSPKLFLILVSRLPYKVKKVARVSTCYYAASKTKYCVISKTSPTHDIPRCLPRIYVVLSKPTDSRL